MFRRFYLFIYKENEKIIALVSFWQIERKEKKNWLNKNGVEILSIIFWSGIIYERRMK